MPDEAVLRQQGELGRELFDRLRAWGRPARVVLAAVDSGDRGGCRAGLEACSLSDAVGSGTPTVVWTAPPVLGEPRGSPTHPPVSVKAWAQQHARKFRHTTGAREHQGQVAVALLGAAQANRAAPTQYVLLRLPGRVSGRRLVLVDRRRHWSEQDCQQMKDGWGLDHCEGRSWCGWHHLVRRQRPALWCTWTV